MAGLVGGGGAVASRRALLGGVGAAALLGLSSPLAAGEAAETGGAFSAAEIAALEARTRTRDAVTSAVAGSRYQPLTGGIVHFFGYGQSLSGGWYGVPILSGTQPYDNLMIGQATRAASQASDSTQWLPTGSPDATGTYPLAPMIATAEHPVPVTAGETPGEGALNFLRRAYLRQLGVTANPACRFVLTNCSAGGHTVAELNAGADPEIFNRLRDAANAVKASAAAQGLSYQVGGMIWTQGEQDVTRLTSYADYLSGLQALQQSFLTQIVQAIGGAPAGTVVPWFCHQPDSSGGHRTIAVHQALLDWASTPGSDLYMGGPVYQYPNHDVHLTANGYRWHGNQIGKAMQAVLLHGGNPRPLSVATATVRATSLVVTLNVPVPPLVLADAYSLYQHTVYPGLGFVVTDSNGNVGVTSARIVGPASVMLSLQRALYGTATLQAGYTLTGGEDWGTNLCDSDPTMADDTYVYTAGVQDPGEAIATWNGAPLIGAGYPLANYLAVGAVPILAG